MNEPACSTDAPRAVPERINGTALGQPIGIGKTTHQDVPRARTCAAAPDVERVLANIDADHGDCAVALLRHGVLLVFAALGQLLSLAGREHGRTISLTEVQVYEPTQGSRQATPLVTVRGA
jgi:hypothetical protein